MKEGPKQLYEFLVNTGAEKIPIEEVITSLPKLYLKKLTIEKWIIKHPDIFQLDNDFIGLVKNKMISQEYNEAETEAKKIDFDAYRSQRNEIVSELRKMLIGPFEEKEKLDTSKAPMSFYLGGKLAPFGSTFEIINEQEHEVNTKELIEGENLDEIISNRNPFRPSTMGFSFQMKKLVPIELKVSWGMYDENNQRIPINERLVFTPKNNKKINLHEPGMLNCKVKEKNRVYHVSVFLMNRYKRDSYPLQSEVMFQTFVSVSFDKKYALSILNKADESNYQDELFYKYVQEYAIGHGVSTNYRCDGDKCYVESDWLPNYELPIVEHRRISNITYEMMEIAKMNKEDLIEKLSYVPSVYEKWLVEQVKTISSLPHHLHQIANENSAKVSKIISRIKKGIDILKNSEECLRAFQFANEVMALQRAQSKVANHYRNTGERTHELPQGEWRLFQIAFILMNISGVSDLESVDREIVDLLWFPTGGGKTEAYLGISAYTMGLRRLKGIWNQPETYSGVCIMMRYTLRLLTIQQFQRATAMICAAEVIRKKNEETWGLEPFRIGLWIGQASTPNKLTDALEKLTEIREGNTVLQGNPMQLQHCPWCGESLTVNNYDIQQYNQITICGNRKCPFSSNEGIPALTVDEAIYRYVPTLLIGTVDKIAQIAWGKDIRELFGRKTHYSPLQGFVNEKSFPSSHRGGIKTKKIKNLLPPDLIIQDELHLISGPLGSLTGLYEIAVDFLCQRKHNEKKIGPKIIASTATIKGADEQIRRLFGREASQFPLPVLDARDTFFSYEIPITEKPGRLYIGVCSPGVSGKIHSVYTYAALLAIVRNIKKRNYLDPYWSILGYFNTIKDLSGTSMLLKDEIPIRLKLVSQQKQDWSTLRTEEMTSRMQASDIPKLLARMEQGVEEGQALDVVLATNMISVGVDVERLGLMVMHNQPKTASEYIQATSRVGRKYPGLVLTLFNSLRSRDLSHFERFKGFHQAMYRYVEATSVTTFAQGTRDRGLEGLIIGLLRQHHPDLAEETAAIRFQIDNIIEEAIEFVVDRGSKTQEIRGEEIRGEIKEMLDWWETRTNEHDSLAYSHKKYQKYYLLKQFHDVIKRQDARPALTSLRNVEPEIPVIEVNYYD
ncbi:helicase domain-containing protein [Clostridium aceticum]|uniref:Helicase domain-containing protein n=1 Tax=Clostridium aceticum TaxID=84022 RepID=A0A0D8IC47_9CLOT|nr:DISARM system helicase DrmA [Clostridium aceticum]AKL94715.1 helicase domain-containing protein [Clostridium aceticum]KJF27674.1 helicase [Clostridium aceticum]